VSGAAPSRREDSENVWLGFMSRTPRWRKSGEALSREFGKGAALEAVAG